MLKSSALGFDKALANLKMFLAMIKTQIITLVILQIVFVSVTIWVFHPKKMGGRTGVCIYNSYIKSIIPHHANFGQQGTYVDMVCGNYAGQVRYEDFKSGAYSKFIRSCNAYILKVFLLTFFGYLIIPLWWLLAHLRNKKDIEDKVLRGIGMIPPEEIVQRIKKNTILFSGHMFRLTKNIVLPESIMTRNILTIGRPGSGKSQMIYTVIQQLFDNGFRCIIHDLKGDMIGNFYDPKTALIFNPLDSRMVRWSLFKELKTAVDIISFCDALVSKDGNDPFWPAAAENVLKSILTLCIYRNETTYDKLWEYINTNNEELCKMFEETVGCESGTKALSEGKMAASVMAVLSTSVASLEFLSMTGIDRYEIDISDAPEEMTESSFKGLYRDPTTKNSYWKILSKNIDGETIKEEYYQYYKESEMFSIKEWIQGEGKYTEYKTIYLSNQVAVQSAVKSFLGMFIQFATTALCSLPDYTAPKTFFILDEFGQLPKMDGILTLLTQGRSKHGSAWLLVQDLAQIKKIYGPEGANIIINNCGNLSFFAVSDEETASILSKTIGSVEIRRTDESRTLSGHEERDTFSQSEKIQDHAVILPKEILDLPTLCCIFKLVDLPVTKDTFEFKKYTVVALAYIAHKVFEQGSYPDPSMEIPYTDTPLATITHKEKPTDTPAPLVAGDSLEDRVRTSILANNAFYLSEDLLEDDLPFGDDDSEPNDLENESEEEESDNTGGFSGFDEDLI